MDDAIHHPPAGTEEMVAAARSQAPNGGGPLIDSPALPELDFLGKAARVDSVAALLQQGQEQLGHLKALMVFNGESLEDEIEVQGVIPGVLRRVSYAKRFEELQTGMNALLGENEDIWEELKLEAVRRQESVVKQIEKSRAGG